MIRIEEAQVRVAAYTIAFESAYLVIRNHVQLLPPIDEHALAEYGYNIFAQRSGKSARSTFVDTFVDTFVAAYPVVHEKLVSGQLTVDPAWTEQERQAIFYVYACKALGLRAT